MKQRLVFLLACFCLLTGVAMAKTVKGIVTDAQDKEPVVGASVIAKGTSTGTMTNVDGEFTLNVPDNAKTLTVSYVGMATKEVAITDGIIKVELTSTSQDLDEVVVVAYGTQKKSSITGAITQVNAAEIEKRPVSSVAQALEGSTSGISVTGNYGQPGEDPTIIIRGVGSVTTSSTTPLYVIDGVPFGGNLSDLNPDDIASMSVLKDAASAALYGNRASNGVILITTKKANKEKVTFNFKTSQGWYVRGIPDYDRTNAEQFMKVEYMAKMAETLGSKYNGVYNAENMGKAHSDINATILSDRLYTNVWDAPNNQIYSDIYGNLTSNVMKGTYGEDLDWWDQSTRAGYRADYNFSGSGATEKSDFYFSLGYLEENGFMNKSGFNRFSGRASVNVKPVSWFKAGLNLNASHQTRKNSKGNGDDNNSYVNPVYYSRYMSPIYPVHLHDPQTGEYVLEQNQKIFDTGYNLDGSATRKQNADRHCIYENQLNSATGVRNTINGITYADFILPYGITASVKGALNVRNSVTDEYGSAVIGDGQADHGRFKRTSYMYKNWSFHQQIRWNYTFDTKHYVEVLLGHENYRYNYDYEYIFKKNESFAGVTALANFATVNSATGYQNNYATESYLARVQYNFDDRYNVEASWRRDGSSRFHKDVRWGNFGSVGANWVFSNEAFMKDFTWLNSGKLRADWGHVANDSNSGYYAYMSLYDSSSGGTNAGNPAYWYSQNGNPELHWETGESWGVALETRLFNRWNFSIEYYKRVNKDLLFDLYDPLSAGAQYPKYPESTKTVNLGKMENSGIEINTDVDIFKNKDWTVNFGMNLTTVRNRITKLPEQNSDGIVDGSKLIVEGRNRFSWYTYHYEGVDMMNGQALYTPDFEKYHIALPGGEIYGGSYELDDNGNPTTKLASSAIPAGEFVKIGDKYYIYNTTYGKKDFRGKALPSIYGAFNPSLRYKNFNLSAVITWSLGGKILDSNYQSLMSVSSSATNYHKDMLNSWYGAPEGMTEDSADRLSTSVNPVASQALSSQNNATSDRFLVSRNYLVFKNINASYTLPKSLVNRISLQNAVVSFTAENLFTKTARQGLDAQQTIAGGQYNYIPSSRVFTFALSVTL